MNLPGLELIIANSHGEGWGPAVPFRAMTNFLHHVTAATAVAGTSMVS